MPIFRNGRSLRSSSDKKSRITAEGIPERLARGMNELARSKGVRPISQNKRSELAIEGKFVCGYLRKHYLVNNTPRGYCSLQGNRTRCDVHKFHSDGVINCCVYDKFLKYRENKDGVTDIEEYRRTL